VRIAINDGIAVEIIYSGHEAVLEFLFGCDADVAQDGAGEFGKETLDEIEPRAMLGCEGEFEPMRGLAREPSSGLSGDMRGMIVEIQLDRRVGRIGRVEKLEEFDEFTAAMAILGQCMDLAGDEVDAGQQADSAVALSGSAVLDFSATGPKAAGRVHVEAFKKRRSFVAQGSHAQSRWPRWSD
jgi:hypothetical protein